MKLNVHYPESALDSGIQGTVYISFVVSETGKVTNVEVEKGVSPLLNAEAVRMVENMPAWVPGRQNGKAVSVRMHLPIQFTIDKAIKSDTAISKINGNFGNRKGFYVVPYLGGGIGKVETDIQFGIIGGGLGIGGIHFVPTGGAEFGYMFNNHFGLFTGAELQKYSAYYNTYYYVPVSIPSVIVGTYYVTQTIYGIKVKYDFTFLHIPVLFQYTSGKPDRPSFHLETGFLFGMPFSASESGTVTRTQKTYPYQGTGSTSTTSSAYNVNTTPDIYATDNGIILNIGILIPFSGRYSLSVDFCNSYKLYSSIGNGKNDEATFGNTSFNYYSGEYGQANAFIIDFKFFIHLGKLAGASVPK